MLLPELKDPRMGRDERGNEVLFRYQGEHIRFIKTDENGDFSYSFYPRYGEAGQWNIAVFAFQRLLGNAATASFDVKGMVADPSNLELTAVKNSSFSKTLPLKTKQQQETTKLPPSPQYFQRSATTTLLPPSILKGC